VLPVDVTLPRGLVDRPGRVDESLQKAEKRTQCISASSLAQDRCTRMSQGRAKGWHLLDVLSGLGGGLEEEQVVLLGEGSAFLLAHLPLALQVALVADQHDDDVAVAVLSAVLEPRRKVLEGLTPAIRWSTDRL